MAVKSEHSETLDEFSSSDKQLPVESYVSGYSDNEIDETDRLNFAKNILWFLFLIVIFVFLASYLSVAFFPDNAKLDAVVNTILDITKTAVPSIVTLVLGFYFGRKE